MIAARFARLAGATAVSLCVLLVGAAAASAQTINVPVGDVSDIAGSCTGSAPATCTSLRAAIGLANSDPTSDTIVLGAAHYQVSSTPLVINPTNPVTVTISGAGSGSTEILLHSGTTGLLQVDFGATVSISGVDFNGGDVPATNNSNSYQPGGEGGAIQNNGNLTLSSDAFSSNQSQGNTYASAPDYGGYGGAVYNDDVLVVTNSTFTGNTADSGQGDLANSEGGLDSRGGAIYNDSNGVATVTSSSFDGNEALGGLPVAAANGGGEGGYGGAIFNNNGIVTVTSSTFGATTANQAVAAAVATFSGHTYAGSGGEGAVLYNSSGSVTLNNDTMHANIAQGSPSGDTGEGGQGGDGGAVFTTYGAVMIHGGSYNQNQAQGGTTPSGTLLHGGSGYGGALYATYGLVVIDSAASFAGNSATGGGYGSKDSVGGTGGEGGAVALYNAELSAANVSFTNDTATAGGSGAGTDYAVYAQGGAIYDQGTLSGTGLTFSGNTAQSANVSNANGGQGGALLVSYGGVASVTGSTFDSNVAQIGYQAGGDGGDGGAVFNDGAIANLTGDAFTNNSAPDGYGGALYLEAATAVLASTLSNNGANYGGAIYTYGAPVSVVNSTIDANLAEQTVPSAMSGQGGGIETGGGTLALASDTIVANQAYGDDGGGNLYIDYSLGLSIHDSVIAEGSLLGAGTVGENCYLDGYAVTDQGYNFEDRNQCGFSGTGDLVSQSDSGLGSLASNGGSTKTVALLAGSSAINAGDPAGCTDANGNVLSTDQRGTARPQGGRCDIGAYEFVPPTVSPPPPGPTTPVLSGLLLSPGVFLSVNGGGSTILYTDNEASSTTFTVTGTVGGYRKGKHGSCKSLPKSGKRPKHTKACSRSVTASFTHQDVAGANTVLLPGQPGGVALPNGSYTLSAKPTFSGLTGASVTASFKIAG